MRRSATPAIPPSMYRHFAIVTVAITAGLAMFADGENREAQAAQVAEAKPAKRAAPVALVTASPKTTRRQEADGWGGFDVSSSPVGSPSGGSSRRVGSDFDGIAAPGYSSEYLASLSEEERELLLRGLQENGMLEPDVQSERAAALGAASRRRSGAPFGND